MLCEHKVKPPAEERTKLEVFVLRFCGSLSALGQGGFFRYFHGFQCENKIGGKPFMAKVELKQPIVDEIKGLFDGAKGAVLVD